MQSGREHTASVLLGAGSAHSTNWSFTWLTGIALMLQRILKLCFASTNSILISKERRKKNPRYLYKNIIILLHSTQYIFKEFQISTRYFSHTGNWAMLGMSGLKEQGRTGSKNLEVTFCFVFGDFGLKDRVPHSPL